MAATRYGEGLLMPGQRKSIIPMGEFDWGSEVRTLILFTRHPFVTGHRPRLAVIGVWWPTCSQSQECGLERSARRR